MADGGSHPALSRRRFINLVGKAGGLAAAYNTMAAMGLLAAPPAHARAPALPGGSGRKTRVIILGAGVAGMTAPYELAKAGYECVVLELHPKYRSDVGKGVAVSWAKVPFSRGAWCEWSEDGKRNAYPVLLEADGPFLFAGEHLSNLAGWQEGAMLSAYKAIEAISARVASRRA